MVNISLTMANLSYLLFYETLRIALFKANKILCIVQTNRNYTAYTLIIWLIIFVILCKRCSRYFKIWKRLHIFVQSSFHLKEINVNWLGAIKQLVSYIGRFLSFCSDLKKKFKVKLFFRLHENIRFYE